MFDSELFASNSVPFENSFSTEKRRKRRRRSDWNRNSWKIHDLVVDGNNLWPCFVHKILSYSSIKHARATSMPNRVWWNFPWKFSCLLYQNQFPRMKTKQCTNISKHTHAHSAKWQRERIEYEINTVYRQRRTHYPDSVSFPSYINLYLVHNRTEWIEPPEFTLTFVSQKLFVR